MFLRRDVMDYTIEGVALRKPEYIAIAVRAAIDLCPKIALIMTLGYLHRCGWRGIGLCAFQHSRPRGFSISVPSCEVFHALSIARRSSFDRALRCLRMRRFV